MSTTAEEDRALTAEVQVVPPLPVDYDMEAATQPNPPFRSQPGPRSNVIFNGSPTENALDKPKNGNKGKVFYVLFVLLAMAVSAGGVWYLMDSKNQNDNNSIVDDQPPVREPTSEGTLPPVPTPGLPKLQISNVKPIMNCMGDCDDDSDCGPGLKCFQRSAGMPVPGCTGGIEDISNTDYCVPAEEPPLIITDAFPLGRCEGDCDTNEDCQRGLVCYQRSELDPVPGCSGGTNDASRTDYCVPREMVPETYLQSMGGRMYGNPDDNFGASVSLSQSEPVRMAVGALDSASAGYVNIYQLDVEDEWVLAGTISGEDHGFPVGSEFGASVSMSWDGKYVAVGSKVGKSMEGSVQVFELVDLEPFDHTKSIFRQVGGDVPVEKISTWGYRYGLSLSQDGSVLAISQPYYFSVYQRNESDDWSMLGSLMELGPIGGNTISISGDGSRVAVNGRPEEVQGSYDVGFGYVFEYDGSEWAPITAGLGDFPIYDTWGLDNTYSTSTSLSGDGKTVVVSATDRPEKTNYVQVYREVSEGRWESMGDPILALVNEFAAPASKVTIRKDGEMLAIGDYELGRIRLYEYDDRMAQWKAAGEAQTDNTNDQFGVMLALGGGSGHTYLAVGGPNQQHRLGSRGYAIAYKTANGVKPDPTEAPSSAPTGGSQITNSPFSTGGSWYGGDDYHGEDGVLGNSVALSGDGRLLAYSVTYEKEANKVFTYNPWATNGNPPPLVGSDADEEFGYSIALSNDGRRIAVGAPNSLIGSQRTGSARIYEFDEGLNFWNPLGGSLKDDVSYEGGRFGHSIDLNDNGDIVAVGSPHNDMGVSVYRLVDNSWVRMGGRITAGASLDSSHGWSLSLSSDGLVLAVGAPTNGENWQEAGACRVYEFVNNRWQLRGGPILGNDLPGYSYKSLFGISASLSGDGNTVAIGTANFNSPDQVRNANGVLQDKRGAGATFIYQYTPEGEWTSLGKPIFGEDSFGRFGTSVSLSKDGKTVAVGAPEHGQGGATFVYQFEDEHLYWQKLRTFEDIHKYESNSGKGAALGTSVAIAAIEDSTSGLTIAIGSPKYKEDIRESNSGITPKTIGVVTRWEH